MQELHHQLPDVLTPWATWAGFRGRSHRLHQARHACTLERVKHRIDDDDFDAAGASAVASTATTENSAPADSSPTGAAAEMATRSIDMALNSGNQGLNLALELSA